MGDHAPDIEVVTFHNEAVGIFAIGLAQHRLPPHECQVLDQRLLVDDTNDDLTSFRVETFVDDQQITAEDTRPFHTVALDFHR